MRFVMLAVFAFFSLWAVAQTQGNVTVTQPDEVSRLLKKHIAVNEKTDGIPGYRIQIFSDSGNNSKRKAMRSKAKFRMSFNDLKAYIVFDAPYYKVEIGNFITRLDAQAVLRQLKDQYPGAYIVYEPEMEIPEL